VGTRTRHIWITALVAALAVITVCGVTTHVCERLRREGRLRVADLAATIAAAIPEERVARIGSSGKKDAPASRELLAYLTATRRANSGVRRISVLVPGGTAAAWRYALATATDPSERVSPGEPYDAGAHPGIERVGSGPTADKAPFHDSHGEWLQGYAPIRDAQSRVVAALAVDMAAGTALIGERRFRIEAAVVCLLLLGGIAFTGFDRYQKQRLEQERHRNIQARLGIHRLAEAMTRAGSEADLLRNALDTVAEVTGFPKWALFRRERDKGPLTLAATRELSPEERRELRPDAAGPGVCAVPLIESGETTGSLQCFASKTRGFAASDETLIRWLATQLGQGLKRLQLESRDQLLASYMRSTDEMLVGFDFGGCVTYANPGACRVLGDSEEELRGRAIDALFVLSENEGSIPLLTQLRRAGGFSGEVTCSTSGRVTFPAEVTVSKAVDREGNETAWILVGRDISERRERDHEIRTRSEQLALINDQLQHANEKLAEGGKMKNEFLANTSHELRTPLNAVIGFATLIEQGIPESEQERSSFARSIRESAEHLLVVINDILDLAKVEAGRLELALETGDATPTILAAAETLRPTALRKGLALTIDIPKESLEMQLDPARLRQVLLNLLGNAVKFTDKGEVRVKAWRHEHPAEIRVAVEDTGIGIAKDDQARLFVKFSQVDGSYKRRRQGTGLGLAITKSLVQRMGGRISMESEGEGLGTRVLLAFPAVSASAESNTARDQCLNES
jgi:PAS domain S-box-containing protein